jgi:plasmid maintenance system antidote protein VapI
MSKATAKPSKPSPVGDVLRSVIEERGLTAYRIAEDAGVSVDAIQRFLKRERGLSLATVDALAHYLGLALVAER